MRIIGIDPGLKATGYGLIDYNNKAVKLVETGFVAPRQKDLIQNRLFKIHSLIDELIVQYQPDVLVLEKLYAHVKHPITASILGHARGIICLLCAERKLELVEHSVKRIRKAVTGNGNASKAQTKKFVAYKLGLDEKKLTLDASDALALALGYVQLSGRKV